MLVNEYIDKGLTHSLHTSERRAFRSCRRRWNWTYREMYYPKVTPGQLEFGVWFHRGMEVYYEPMMWGKDFETQKFLALKAFRDAADHGLKEYKRLNGEPEVEVLNDYKERRELGLNMLKFYIETVSPLYDKDFTPVEVEVEFEVPVIGPQGEEIWCKCDRCWEKEIQKHDTQNVWIDWKGLPVTYGGRLDMLVKDELGRYWVVDFKTTIRLLNEGTEESFLELDDQVSSYVWALKAHYNIPVAGFIYLEIKKAFPTPPEELSRLYKGRKFSTNKQNITSVEIFTQHVLENDPDALAVGLYDEYLEWLKTEGPRFHQRHQIHKNDHEVDEIGRNIYLEALDMIEKPRVYPQPGRFSCTTCLFRQPCLGMNQGEHYEYTLETLFERRDKHYYEERQPTTD